MGAAESAEASQGLEDDGWPLSLPLLKSQPTLGTPELVDAGISPPHTLESKALRGTGVQNEHRDRDPDSSDSEDEAEEAPQAMSNRAREVVELQERYDRCAKCLDPEVLGTSMKGIAARVKRIKETLGAASNKQSKDAFGVSFLPRFPGNQDIFIFLLCTGMGVVIDVCVMCSCVCM